MQLLKANKSLGSESSFGLGNILGLIFLLIGILLIISLQNFNLPIDLGNFEVILEYGAAAGSILGGYQCFLRKKKQL